jgi:hypothetical protein
MAGASAIHRVDFDLLLSHLGLLLWLQLPWSLHAGYVSVASRQLIHPIDCRCVGTRYEMPVCVYRELDGAVPQLVSHVGQTLPSLSQQRGIGMAEGMGFVVGELRCCK